MGFSPSVSLYFGAPKMLVQNSYTLIVSCLLISLILGIPGLYAISGAGYIRPLPGMRRVLVVTSFIFIIRGILLIPELMIIVGIFEVSFYVAPRYVVFSIGVLLVGLAYLTGTICGWRSFPTI